MLPVLSLWSECQVVVIDRATREVSVQEIVQPNSRDEIGIEHNYRNGRNNQRSDPTRKPAKCSPVIAEVGVSDVFTASCSTAP